MDPETAWGANDGIASRGLGVLDALNLAGENTVRRQNQRSYQDLNRARDSPGCLLLICLERRA